MKGAKYEVSDCNFLHPPTSSSFAALYIIFCSLFSNTFSMFRIT